MPDAPKTHLCPVCSMPAPLGLVHCSLACEEQDPLPQPEEDTRPPEVTTGWPLPEGPK